MAEGNQAKWLNLVPGLEKGRALLPFRIIVDTNGERLLTLPGQISFVVHDFISDLNPGCRCRRRRRQSMYIRGCGANPYDT